MNTCLTIIILLFSLTSNIQATPPSIFWVDTERSLLIRGDLQTLDQDTILIPRQPGAFFYSAPYLYWADQESKTIYQEAAAILTLQGTIRQLVVHPTEEILYWLETDPLRIRRANLDGTGATDLVQNEGIRSFALDTVNHKLYWLEPDRIRRSNSDGSGVVDIISESPMGWDLALDLASNRLYWSAGNNAENLGIYRSHLDGSHGELLTPIGFLDQFAINPTHNTIYYSGGDRTIERYNIQTDSHETIISGIGFSVMEMYVDPETYNLIWLENELDARRIMRAEANGDHSEPILTGIGPLRGLTIDSEAGRLYMTDQLNQILSSDFDGSNVERIAYAGCGIGQITDIVLDHVNDILYIGYGGSCGQAFSQIRPDGANYATHSLSLHQAGSLVVDPYGKGVFWAGQTIDFSNSTLFRVGTETMSSSHVETILETGSFVSDMEVNLEQGRLYWLNISEGSINRSDLYGRSVETLLTELEDPVGLALDVENNRMYWTERGSGKIRSAGLDGSEPVDVFTGLSRPGSMALTFQNNGIPVSIDRNQRYGNVIRLNPNYPNPFNPTTVISFQLPVSGDVRLEVYDMLGRRVAVLMDETQQAGEHRITFDASNLTSGVYISRLSIGGISQTKKMILIK